MEDNRTEDCRRFTIYFHANDHLDGHAINDLKISQYVQLHNYDKEAWSYVKKNLSNIFNEGEELERLWRSIDDVHYTMVKSPEELDSQRSTSQKSQTDQNANSKDAIEAPQIITPDLDKSVHNSDNNNISSNVANSCTLNFISTHKQLDNRINTDSSNTKGSIIWNHVKKIEKDNIMYTQCNYCLKLFKYSNNTTNMINQLSRMHPIFFKKPKMETIAPNFSSSNNGQLKRVSSQEVGQPTKKKFLEREKENSTISFLKETDQNNKDKTNTSNLDKVQKNEPNKDIRVMMKTINDMSAGGSKSDKITNWIVYMLCRDLCPISAVEKEGFLLLMKILVPLHKVPSRKTITGIIENRYHSIQKVFSTELKNTNYYCVTADNWTDCSKQSYIGGTIHYLTDAKILRSEILGCIPLYERHNAEYLESSLLEIFNDFSIKKEKITAIVTDGGSEIKKAAISIIGSSRQKKLECSHPIDILNREEIKIIRDVLQLMKPVNSTITELSGEKYATAGVVIPLINCLKFKLNSYNPVTEIGTKLKVAVLAQINDKFSTIEDSLLARSTILDPRFKKLHFMKPLAVANHIAYLNNTLKRMDSVSESQESEGVITNFTECQSLWDIHEYLKEKSETYVKPNNYENDSGTKHTELNLYLQQPCIDKEKNIFTYWRDMNEVFPFLSIIAFKQLCILATTVPSERLFSKAGLIKRFTLNKKIAFFQ